MQKRKVQSRLTLLTFSITRFRLIKKGSPGNLREYLDNRKWKGNILITVNEKREARGAKLSKPISLVYSGPEKKEAQRSVARSSFIIFQLFYYEVWINKVKYERDRKEAAGLRVLSVLLYLVHSVNKEGKKRKKEATFPYFLLQVNFSP